MLRVVIAVLVAATTPARADELWLRPVDQVALHLAAYDEADRPYSVPARPRDIAGEIAISCEHTEGRPCGDGAGAYGELDSNAGYADWITAGSRLRVRTGSTNYGTSIDLDRLHVEAHAHGFALEVGRDAFVLGPPSHTQVGWGDNAAPLDFARASYANERGGLMYLVGRLRDPQTFHGDLVTIARGELELGPVTLGGMQLLQLDGDGAPQLSAWQFVEEHFTRTDASASTTDSSNRRVGLDINWKTDAFGGTRFYYQLMFEDWRKQFLDAIAYDADHVFGIETNGLLIEYQKTGFRSMEHVPRTTGFTNADRAVGSPLGPDAQAFYASYRLPITPWIELARLASDTYSYGYHQPIIRLTNGQAELRYRCGARTQHAVTRRVTANLEVLYEHVEDFAFVTGARRNSIGAELTLIYR